MKGAVGNSPPELCIAVLNIYYVTCISKHDVDEELNMHSLGMQ